MGVCTGSWYSMASWHRAHTSTHVSENPLQLRRVHDHNVARYKRRCAREALKPEWLQRQSEIKEARRQRRLQSQLRTALTAALPHLSAKLALLDRSLASTVPDSPFTNQPTTSTCPKSTEFSKQHANFPSSVASTLHHSPFLSSTNVDLDHSPEFDIGDDEFRQPDHDLSCFHDVLPRFSVPQAGDVSVALSPTLLLHPESGTSNENPDSAKPAHDPTSKIALSLLGKTPTDPLDHSAPVFASVVTTPTATFSIASDLSRIPWQMQASKSHALYHPTVPGRWWSQSLESWETLSVAKQKTRSHVGRIMETSLGLQLFGGARCKSCIRYQRECWVYDPVAYDQVAYVNPTCNTCSRCRLTPNPAGGCSVVDSKGKGNKTPKQQRTAAAAPVSTPLRSLLPRLPISMVNNSLS